MNRTIANRTTAALWLLGVWLGALTATADQLLVANKSDDTLEVIDLDDGTVVETIPTGPQPHEVAVSADGSKAVVADYRGASGTTLTLVHLDDDARTERLSLGTHRGPHGVVWLDDGFLVTAEGSRHLLRYDAEGELTAAIRTGEEVSHMVAVTPDQRLAFVANIGSGTVTVIDLEREVKVKDIETGRGAEGIAVTPDGTEVWVTNRADDTVSVIEVDRLAVGETIHVPAFPIRAEISADGAWVLVTAARSGEVVLIDRARRRVERRTGIDLEGAALADDRLFADRFDSSPVPIGIEIHPDGDRFWVAATRSDVVVEMSLPDLAVLRVLPTGREPDGMALVVEGRVMGDEGDG